MLEVLFVACECAPFAKSGGLADIMSSLPKEMYSQGYDVRVIMPKYGMIAQEYKDKMTKTAEINVPLGWRDLYCGIWEMVHENITYYFIDNELYFNREGIYGYDDDGERFAYFSRAVLETIASLEKLKPDVIHCNDWHTALVPLFFKEMYKAIPYFSEMKTVFTIHNLKHQGNFDKAIFDDLLGLAGRTEAWKALEYYDRLNFMKAGIVMADKVTTVSPTYAEEIKGGFYGEGLDFVIASREEDFVGILNGIPKRKQPFYKGGNRNQIMPKKLADFKAENKAELQEWMGLDVRKDVPVVGLVTRFVEQKGIDLITYILNDLLQGDTQFAFLGAGDAKYEDAFRHFQAVAPGRFAVRTEYDENVAEKIFQGADFLLVPSLFEPCGLTQMMAMEYGTLPIVRETGGLKDTVVPYNQFTGEGNGFSFANFNAHELLEVVNVALTMYWEDNKALKKLSNEAAKTNFEWGNSAKAYADIYESFDFHKDM